MKELEEVAATAGVAYIECDFTVEILRAPVVCNGQTVKDIPATASDYIVAFKASANLQAASQALLAVKLQEVSQ